MEHIKIQRAERQKTLVYLVLMETLHIIYWSEEHRILYTMSKKGSVCLMVKNIIVQLAHIKQNRTKL